jgi:DNA mismatch repair protein MutS
VQGLKLTPMMEQWHKAKLEHPDAILLFRMGDFYELFGEDAIKAAPILELALTSRDKDKSGLKMAGFPFHAAASYIAKLIEHGHKVAICEQLENPRDSRGIVKRGIVNVITPGTAIAIDDAKPGETAFLLGLYVSDEQNIALCALDLSTTTFKITSSMSREKIFDEALRLMPKEIVIKADDELAKDLSRNLEQSLKRSQMVRIEKRQYFSNEHVKSYLREISLSAADQLAA